MIFYPQANVEALEVFNRVCGRIFAAAFFHRVSFHIPQGLWRKILQLGVMSEELGVKVSAVRITFD